MSAASLIGVLASSTPLGLLLKVTLLLLLAGMLVAVMRRRSAAARHFVWALALGSSLALAALSPLVPHVPLPVGTAQLVVRAPNDAFDVGVINIRGRDAPGTVISGESRVSSMTPRAQRLPGRTLPATWALGAAAMAAWLILGHLGLARLTRNASRVVDDDWLIQLAAVRASLGVTRRVRLYSSTAVGAPITWGFLRPIVVLPVGASAWGAARRRVVLEHELAHIARHDYLMQLIASVTCALYWFHPGVWFAARRLRNESERACDDAVLACGTSAADYAAHLLSVATGSRALRLSGAVAIGMARQSALEGRLLAALNPTVARAPLSARVRRYSTVALGALTLPLAGLRAVPRTPAVDVPEVIPPASVTSVAPPARTTQVPAAREDSTLERSFPASRGERLDLDLGPGGDIDIRGWDEDRVRVRATFGGVNWRDMTVEIVRDDQGIVVRSRFARQRRMQSTNNRYEIRVPRRFDVRISSSGGDVTIQDVEGEFRGTTGGGQIVLERVRGHASLGTGGGDIRVNDVNMDGRVSTGGGMVTLSSVSGGLRGSSGSGPVIYGDKPNATNEPGTADISAIHVDKDRERIRLRSSGRSQGGASRINISKAGGDVILEEAPAGAVIHTGGGKVRVGRSAGLVEASTGGGDVTVGPVAGSVVASTGAGTVSVTLIEAAGTEQTVEIEAGVGRVIVELPSSFDGSFDLETAYSRRFGRATRIESDWSLDREATEEWDDRQGTPRRYVRAHGSVGRGRGRIYIKTMNGDIEIRRGR